MFLIGDTSRTGRLPCKGQDARNLYGIAFNVHLLVMKIIYMPQKCLQFCFHFFSHLDRRLIGS